MMLNTSRRRGLTARRLTALTTGAVLAVAALLIAPAAGATDLIPAPPTPVAEATTVPTDAPTGAPSDASTTEPTTAPTAEPTTEPTTAPSPEPTPGAGCDADPVHPLGTPVVTPAIGSISIGLPAATSTDCFDLAAYWVVITTTQNDFSYFETVPVPATGFAGATLDIPFDATAEYSVNVYTFGRNGDEAPERLNTLYSKKLILAADAYAFCAASAGSFDVVSSAPDVSVEPGAGTLTVKLSPFSTLGCVDSATLSVYVYRVLDTYDDANAPVLIGSADGAVSPGTLSFTAELPAGTYVARAWLATEIDGQRYDDRNSWYALGSDGEIARAVVSPAAGPATTPGNGDAALAETGVETSSMLAGAVILLLAGAASLLMRRRRVSVED